MGEGQEVGVIHIGVFDKLTPWENILYGFQHYVLNATSGFTVPIIFGFAFGLDTLTVATLISASLLFGGIATISRYWFDLPAVELPSIFYLTIMMPVAFQFGLPYVYPCMAIAGFISCLLCLPSKKWGLLGKVVKYIAAPTVIGSIFTVMGPALIVWVTLPLIFGRAPYFYTGWTLQANLILAVIAFAIPFAVQLFVKKGMLRYSCVLIGVVVALIAATAMGVVDWSPVATAPWFNLPRLFPVGAQIPPLDSFLAIVAMLMLANIADFLDSTGSFIQIYKLTGQELDEGKVNKAVFTETLISSVGTLFGNQPTTTYMQNVGLISLTGVAAKSMILVTGGILVVVSFIYKLNVAFSLIPGAIMGGTQILVFGLLMLIGIEEIGGMKRTHVNNAIAGLSLMMGFICMLLPTAIKDTLPTALALFVGSPPLMAGIVALVLHLILVVGLKKE
jgi:NCS2 family nucleobase:cation symporter-2